MQKEKRYKDERLNAAVDELNNYRELQRKLRFLRAKKLDYEQRYPEIKSCAYDKLKVDGGEFFNNVEDIAIRWEDLNSEIERMQLDAEHQMLYIQVKLNALTTLQTRVLQLYYVECNSLIEVAREMYYSIDGIRRLKFKALERYACS